MKKSIKSIFGILISILLFTSFTFSQEQTMFNIQRTIELKHESQIKEVKFEMNEKDCRFDLRISSVVQKGEVTVEIYDPNGKKQGNFSVGCQVGSEDSLEIVNGMITKRIDNPILGDWKVKISPNNANGKVTILFEQNIIIKKQAIKL